MPSPAAYRPARQSPLIPFGIVRRGYRQSPAGKAAQGRELDMASSAEGHSCVVVDYATAMWYSRGMSEPRTCAIWIRNWHARCWWCCGSKPRAHRISRILNPGCAFSRRRNLEAGTEGGRRPVPWPVPQRRTGYSGWFCDMSTYLRQC